VGAIRGVRRTLRISIKRIIQSISMIADVGHLTLIYRRFFGGIAGRDYEPIFSAEFAIDVPTVVPLLDIVNGGSG